jgi:hypothetical protein
LVDDAKPVFFKASTIPFKLRDKVSQEIDRLCNDNKLQVVKH